MTAKRYDVVAPVSTPSGKTVWVKLGSAWQGSPTDKYVMKLSILSLPIGVSGPLELLLYPAGAEPEPEPAGKL